MPFLGSNHTSIPQVQGRQNLIFDIQCFEENRKSSILMIDVLQLGQLGKWSFVLSSEVSISCENCSVRDMKHVLRNWNKLRCSCRLDFTGIQSRVGHISVMDSQCS